MHSTKQALKEEVARHGMNKIDKFAQKNIIFRKWDLGILQIKQWTDVFKLRIAFVYMYLLKCRQ